MQSSTTSPRIEVLESRRLLSAYIEDRVLHVDGTAEGDTIRTSGGHQSDPSVEVFLNGITQSFDLEDFDSIFVRGFAGNEFFDDRGPSATFEGGDGQDVVVTEDDDDGRFATVVGGAGDDIVEFAVDSIGRTTLAPFDGGPGRDNVVRSGEGGNLDLRDFPSVEDGVQASTFGNLTGNALNNSLRMLTNGGVVLGGAGNDRLLGSDGDDTLDGGDGNDTLDGGLGADFLQGWTGLDTVDYSSRTANLGITIDGAANDGTRGSSGPPTEGDNVMTDVETVLAGSGNDYIFGNGLNNLFRGNGGNDFLGGFGGHDALYGGSGHDRLEGGNGNDYLEGSSGNDALVGGAGTDFFFAGDGDDWLYSRDGIGETVIGGNGFDRAQRDASDNVSSIEAFLA
jgi:Ca2+-binding RTX toxin-like protein